MLAQRTSRIFWQVRLYLRVNVLFHDLLLLLLWPASSYLDSALSSSLPAKPLGPQACLALGYVLTWFLTHCLDLSHCLVTTNDIRIHGIAQWASDSWPCLTLTLRSGSFLELALPQSLQSIPNAWWQAWAQNKCCDWNKFRILRELKGVINLIQLFEQR
jgi:hypothetical protein